MLCKLRVNKRKTGREKEKNAMKMRGRKTTYYLCMSFHTLPRRFFMTGAEMFTTRLQLYLQLHLWAAERTYRYKDTHSFN